MLRGTIMQIVDAVQIHVLCMPRKGRFPHAKVQVCRVHTLNLDAVVLIHKIKNAAQAVYVPDVLVLVIEGARDISTIDRLVERNVLPVLPLQLFIVFVLWCSVPKATNTIEF